MAFGNNHCGAFFPHFLVSWVIFLQRHTARCGDVPSDVSSDHLGRFGQFVRRGMKQLSSSLFAWEPTNKQEVLACIQLSEQAL